MRLDLSHDLLEDRVMSSLNMKIEAEHRMLELLAHAALPEPDRVEYGEQCIRLFWDDRALVVVIDLEEEPEVDPQEI